MPDKAYVEITNVCNLRCTFCHGTVRPARFLSPEEFRTIAEKLDGKVKYLYLHLMGEPLLHPQLGEILQIVSGMKVRLILTTNGTLLKKRGDELIAAGVYKVNISLHSFENEKEYKQYIDDCLDFADKASKSGVLVVLRLWNSGFDGGKNEDIVKRIRERFSDSEWMHGKRGVRIHHKLHLEYGERFEWPDMQAAESCGRAFCYGLADHFGVLVDGSVIPCCLDAEGVIKLGNIFEDDIAAILTSERANAIRQGFKDGIACEELCRKCGYARRFVRNLTRSTN